MGCLSQLMFLLGSKMVYFEALGHSVLVINDIGVARDLLEKRSAIYSSRCVGAISSSNELYQRV
jgi:hypothetical protein